MTYEESSAISTISQGFSRILATELASVLSWVWTRLLARTLTFSSRSTRGRGLGTNCGKKLVNNRSVDCLKASTVNWCSASIWRSTTPTLSSIWTFIEFLNENAFISIPHCMLSWMFVSTTSNLQCLASQMRISIQICWMSLAFSKIGKEMSVFLTER